MKRGRSLPSGTARIWSGTIAKSRAEARLQAESQTLPLVSEFQCASVLGFRVYFF
jgi:hypothetical protein